MFKFSPGISLTAMLFYSMRLRKIYVYNREYFENFIRKNPEEGLYN